MPRSGQTPTRREFSRAVGMAALSIPLQTVPSLALEPQINTVLGPIPPAALGRTLIHEHVLVDFIGADKIVPGRYDGEDVYRLALPHLQRAKSLGCETFVDCTPAYLGRDPGLLARLAEASKLQILTNTGFYGAVGGKFVPAFARKATPEALAAGWTREWERGIEPTGIRPALIKIGVDAGPLSALSSKLVSAAALTHARTGLPIASHTGDGIAAAAQLELLKQRGVPAAAFIWVHAQDEKDPASHRAAAAQGAFVEFDGLQTDTLDLHLTVVRQMKQAGYLRNVLISQDAGWYHVEQRGGGYFRGYDLLFSHFLPKLRAAGFSAADIQTLLVDNPRKALTPRP